MSSPTILLGIVTRNRAAMLLKAILSGLSQRDCSLRLEVVDDGSSDGTGRLEEHLAMVEWTRRFPSRGYMAARNDWMNSASHDYFVSLDDDAWFLEGDEVSLAIGVLEGRPQVGAVAFDILSRDRPNRVTRGAPRLTAMFVGCGHVVRLAAIQRVGVYSNTPGDYGGEEKDLCLRLMDAGYEIVLLPGVHVWHDKTQIARVIPDQHRSGVCNDLVMTLRRTPTALLPVALPAKLYRHFMFSCRHGLTWPCFQGVVWFVRSVPSLWRSRRPVKAATLRTFMRLARL